MDEDDEDQPECWRCERIVDEDELDDEGVCKCCNEADEDRRQLESDYRFWCR